MSNPVSNCPGLAWVNGQTEIDLLQKFGQQYVDWRVSEYETDNLLMPPDDDFDGYLMEGD